MILRKIINIAATRCHILKLKCTKFDFGWGSAQTPLGELTALHRPLAGFKGPTSKEGEEKGGEGERRRGQGKGAGKGREGKGRRGGEGEWGSPIHYFRHKSCTGAGNGREGRREGGGGRGGDAPKGTAVGCRYLPPGPRLPSHSQNITASL